VNFGHVRIFIAVEGVLGEPLPDVPLEGAYILAIPGNPPPPPDLAIPTSWQAPYFNP